MSYLLRIPRSSGFLQKLTPLIIYILDLDLCTRSLCPRYFKILFKKSISSFLWLFLKERTILKKHLQLLLSFEITYPLFSPSQSDASVFFSSPVSISLLNVRALLSHFSSLLLHLPLAIYTDQHPP